jgi:diacylglycerol kinase (ATP)
MRRRALLLVNDKSRRGGECAPELLGRLQGAGIELVRVECGKLDLTREIVSRAANADMVVVGGGDGTLNSAAPGLMASRLPLGIVPLGTANDLARTLGIPPEPERAIEIILGGRTKRIDVGQVDGHPFFNVASLGLSVELARVLTRDVKRRFGRLGYGLAALRVLFRARPFYATIVSGSESARVATLQIAVGNGRHYGSGNTVNVDACIDDQRLDLYSLEFRRAWKLALMARSFRSGEHGAWEEVRVMCGQAFEIRTRRPRPINADGEIVAQTPAQFTIAPQAVTVFVP